MTDFGRFDAYVADHAARFFDELIAYGRQPSVSATGEGIEAMAPKVVATLERVGAAASIVDSPARHRAVIGEVGGGRRTLLLYDHYDVQPPGDPAAWSTPPWEPTLRDGALFGRGIADDKAELLARIHAVEAWQAALGALPVRVRWIVEGEHEIGSPGLAAVLRANRSRLEADVCLSEGTGRDELGHVTINLGCRGFVSVELAVRLRPIPLASSLGGLLPSASDRLMRAVLSVVGPDGALLIDGVAERVPPPSTDDEAMLRAIPWSEASAREALGIDALTPGLAGIDLLRHHLLEPFVAICAVNSGDPSWGLVVPGEAGARLDIRLVPGLDPDVVVDLLRRHLEARGFSDVSGRGARIGGAGPDGCVIAGGRGGDLGRTGRGGRARADRLPADARLLRLARVPRRVGHADTVRGRRHERALEPPRARREHRPRRVPRLRPVLRPLP